MALKSIDLHIHFMKTESLPKYFQDSNQDANGQAILCLALHMGTCHGPQKEQSLQMNTEQQTYLVSLAWNNIPDSRKSQALRSWMSIKCSSLITSSLLPPI